MTACPHEEYTGPEISASTPLGPGTPAWLLARFITWASSGDMTATVAALRVAEAIGAGRTVTLGDAVAAVAPRPSAEPLPAYRTFPVRMGEVAVDAAVFPLGGSRAVYALVNGRATIYVGQTANLSGRVRSHAAAGVIDQTGGYSLRVYRFGPEVSADWAEAATAVALQPAQGAQWGAAPTIATRDALGVVRMGAAGSHRNLPCVAEILAPPETRR